MSHLPCTACQRRTPWRNSGIYLHQWGAGPQTDYRLRLCPQHLTAFQNDLSKHEVAWADDAVSVVNTPSECFSCGKPVSEVDWHLSVTAYPAKDQRKDYWSRLHIDCTLPDWAKNGQPLL